MSDPLRTPDVSTNAALWVAGLEVGDLAWLAGCVCGKLAAKVGITQAALFADWARRSAADPDCNKVDPA